MCSTCTQPAVVTTPLEGAHGSGMKLRRCEGMCTLCDVHQSCLAVMSSRVQSKAVTGLSRRVECVTLREMQADGIGTTTVLLLARAGDGRTQTTEPTDCGRLRFALHRSVGKLASLSALRPTSAASPAGHHRKAPHGMGELCSHRQRLNAFFLASTLKNSPSTNSSPRARLLTTQRSAALTPHSLSEQHRDFVLPLPQSPRPSNRCIPTSAHDASHNAAPSHSHPVSPR